MDSIPDEQRSWTVTCQGIPRKVLRLRTDWPVQKGTLSGGEVLVKVQAAGLNPSFLLPRPHGPENDFSGLIIDENESGFVPGDSVYGYVPNDNPTFDFTAISWSYTAGHTTGLPVAAAGISLATLTAYQVIHHMAQVEPEQTVFVNGGNSACGAFAIQMAKAKGAKVVATASAKNEQFVRKLGADEFIDYTQGPVHEYLIQHIRDTKYHVIFDAVGLSDPSLFTWCEKYLAPDGVFISNNPDPNNLSVSELWQGVKTLFAVFVPAWLGGVNRRYLAFLTRENNEDMRAIQGLLESGIIKPIVDSTNEFEDALEAYDRIMSSRAVGKVVVKIDPACN